MGPIVLGFIQVFGTFGAAQAQPDARPPDALAVALALVGPSALLLIPRHTVPLLIGVTAATFTYLALGYPYGPVLASFAITVALAVVRGARVLAWFAVATALVLATSLRLWAWDLGWSWTWFAGAKRVRSVCGLPESCTMSSRITCR